MAPHSSTLAWKTPWMEEPGRLQSMGSLIQTRLSDLTFTFHFHALEKEMATHSSVLAWRILGMGEPGRVILWLIISRMNFYKWLLLKQFWSLVILLLSMLHNATRMFFLIIKSDHTLSLPKTFQSSHCLQNKSRRSFLILQFLRTLPHVTALANVIYSQSLSTWTILIHP